MFYFWPSHGRRLVGSLLGRYCNGLLRPLLLLLSTSVGAGSVAGSRRLFLSSLNTLEREREEEEIDKKVSKCILRHSFSHPLTMQPPVFSLPALGNEKQ
jgi:small neutral amino acid transporter SnatA (MarC family)